MTFDKSNTAVNNLGGMLAQDAKNTFVLTGGFLNGFLQSPIMATMTHDIKSILLHFLEDLIASGVHIAEGALPSEATPLAEDLEKWVDAYLSKLIMGTSAP